MKRSDHTIIIDAAPEKIWNVLWDDRSYRDWTSAFYPGSYAKTDGWKQGTIVHFLSPEGSGMYSRIAEHVPMQRMEFEHLGVVKDGKEQPQDDETRKWAGGREIYTLQQNDRGMRLTVEMDIAEGSEDMMAGAFPKALQRVKELAEQ